MRAAWFFLLLALGVCVDGQEAAAGDETFDTDDFDGEPQGAAEPAEEGADDSLGADDEEYVDRFAITSSKYVRVQVVFPDHGGISALDSLLNLRIGEVTPVLVGFANDGDESLNITAIGMYLHSAYDHSYFIQNFTKREYGRVVRAHEEIALEYTFQCDPNYEPMIYQISGAIEYRSMDDDYDFRDYSTEFVNATIDYLPAPSRLSTTMIFGYGLFFLVVAGASYRYLDFGSIQLFESQSGSGPSILKSASSRSQKENAELDGPTEEERRKRVENSFLTDTNGGNNKKKKNLKKTKKKKK